MPEPRIVLFTKPGCHLCDDMHDVLQRVLRGTPITVHLRNITEDLDVFERYKHDVPVLVIDGREVARHRITDDVLADALRAAGLPT